MKEKRLSIRFRMDNPQDTEAWDILQRISEEDNTYKNAVALRLICKGAVSAEVNDNASLVLIAERIADQIANKLESGKMQIKGIPASENKATSTVMSGNEPQIDEFRAISKDALSFLDEF